jgi:hypothetical protein
MAEAPSEDFALHLVTPVGSPAYFRAPNTIDLQTRISHLRFESELLQLNRIAKEWAPRAWARWVVGGVTALCLAGVVATLLCAERASPVFVAFLATCPTVFVVTALGYWLLTRHSRAAFRERLEDALRELNAQDNTKGVRWSLHRFTVTLHFLTFASLPTGTLPAIPSPATPQESPLEPAPVSNIDFCYTDNKRSSALIVATH